MNISHLILESLFFLSVFFSRLLPPMMSCSRGILDFSSIETLKLSLITLLTSLIIVFTHSFLHLKILCEEEGEKGGRERGSSQLLFHIYLGYFLLSLGILFLVSGILEFAAYKLNYQTPTFRIRSPEGCGWVVAIFTILFSAGSEEFLYRLFTPSSIGHILNYIKLEKDQVFSTFSLLTKEAVSCFIFAFSHRYLGVFSVLNASVGHAIFRFCYKKTNIFLCIFMHFLYNFFILIFVGK